MHDHCLSHIPLAAPLVLDWEASFGRFPPQTELNATLQTPAAQPIRIALSPARCGFTLRCNLNMHKHPGAQCTQSTVYPHPFFSPLCEPWETQHDNRTPHRFFPNLRESTPPI